MMKIREERGLREGLRVASWWRVSARCVAFIFLPLLAVAQRVEPGSLQTVSVEVEMWQRALLRREADSAQRGQLDLIDSLLRGTGKIEVLQRGEQGLLALLRGDRPGRRVALRAEVGPVDTLQIAPYVSQRHGRLLNWRHAESALLLGVAKILAQMQETLRGDIYFIFEVHEARECSSARALAGAQALQRVEAVYSLALEAGGQGGIVGLLPAGEVSPAEDGFRLQLLGRGGDGALPEQCADAVVAGSALVGALQTLVSRGASPRAATTLTIGRIQAGESAKRVASRALLEGTVYTRSASERDRMAAGIRTMGEGIARAYGVALRSDYAHGAQPLRNDGELTEAAHVAAEKAVGKRAVRRRGEIHQGVCLSGYASLAPLCLYTVSAEDTDGAARVGPYVSQATIAIGLKVEVQLALEFLGRR